MKKRDPQIVTINRLSFIAVFRSLALSVIAKVNCFFFNNSPKQREPTKKHTKKHYLRKGENAKKIISECLRESEKEKEGEREWVEL